jgi:hypothetical protein
MAITINGKEYNEADLSPDLKNAIVARQEILNSKARHLVEIEKIDVLTNYYNSKIEGLVKDTVPAESEKVADNVVTETKSKKSKKKSK